MRDKIDLAGKIVPVPNVLQYVNDNIKKLYRGIVVDVNGSERSFGDHLAKIITPDIREYIDASRELEQMFYHIGEGNEKHSNPEFEDAKHTFEVLSAARHTLLQHEMGFMSGNAKSDKALAKILRDLTKNFGNT